MTETTQLGDMPRGTKYIGRDGNTEYIVTDLPAESDSVTWVVSLTSGKVSSVSHSTDFVKVDGRWHVK